MDHIQCVSHALQIDRIGRIGGGLILTDRRSRRIVTIGRRERGSRRHSEISLRGRALGRVHCVKRIFVALLLVVEVKEQFVLANRAANIGAKLLQDVHRLRIAGCLVHRIIGAGAGVAVVIERIPVPGIGA